MTAVLHEQSRRALEVWASGPQVTDPGFGLADVAALRDAARRAAAEEHKEPVAAVEDLDLGGVPCRVHRPTTAPVHGTLVFCHGGGFVFGDRETHDGQARRLANRTGLAVVTVDYRRPPEHPFPAAPDDVDSVVGTLSRDGERHGLDPARVALVGDSAGGNLALVASLRNPGLSRATVLVMPFLDPGLEAASYRREDGGGLTRAEARWYWRQYAASTDALVHPDLAPLRSDETRLSRLREPVLVQVAEHDPLVDEDRELAGRLRAAGVEVHLTEYPGMVHGFWRHPQLFDAAEASVAEIAAFLRARV